MPLKPKFFIYLYFGGHRLQVIFLVALPFAASPLNKFEKCKSWDAQTGNSSQDEDDDINPGGVRACLEGREVLLFERRELNSSCPGSIPAFSFCDTTKSYRFLVPHQISQTLGDLGYKVENQDEYHDEWANHPPCHLPENIGLVANHKLDILVKPAEMHQKRNRQKLHLHLFGHVLDTPMITDII